MNLIVTQFSPNILPAPPPLPKGRLCFPTRLSSISNFNVRFDSRQGQGIFSLPKRPDRFWGPTSLLFNGYQGYSTRDKAEGLGMSGAPTTCPHGIDRDFTFFYRCTVHSDICRVHLPTNALLLI